MTCPHGDFGSQVISCSTMAPASYDDIRPTYIWMYVGSDICYNDIHSAYTTLTYKHLRAHLYNYKP